MKKQFLLSLLILSLSIVAKAMGWTQVPVAQVWIRAILIADYDYLGAFEEAKKLFEGLQQDSWQVVPPRKEELPALVRPAMGKVSSGFGTRKHPILGGERDHRGIDLEAPLGSPILAALPGTVQKVERDPTYGLKIVLEHSDEYETLYAHCREALVKPGEKVSAGQVIGRVGDSGLATGPHLHFELRVRGKAVDPDQLIK